MSKLINDLIWLHPIERIGVEHTLQHLLDLLI